LQEFSTIDNVCLQPEKIVSKYYQSLYSGDLKSVKALMTKESYYMTLEPFGMGLAFKDSAFKMQWDKIEESQDAIHEVEKKISVSLLADNISPHIEIKKIAENGSERKIVYYEEDGEKKKLYFSHEDGLWLIDYFAGCPISPVQESCVSFVKKWFSSLLPFAK